MSSNLHYHSYLLRLWRDGAGTTGNQPWRASLQCAVTGEKLAFANILTLFAFLAEKLSVDEDTNELAHLAAWLQMQIVDTDLKSGGYL